MPRSRDTKKGTAKRPGNLGIGTTDPNYKLEVVGDINVTGSYNIKKAGTNYAHPDYVFMPDYQLMPIDKLKDFVLTNKHLPNVISAEEVEQAQGFKMDELLIQILEKLEEQTLYIINLNEENQEQQEEILALKKRLEGLETKK